MLKKCSPKCFEVYSDSCVEYTGPDIQELRISQGSSLQAIITELASALLDLKRRVDACSFCNGEQMIRNTDELVNMSEISQTSITEVPINSRISVKAEAQSSGTEIAYVISELPQGTMINSDVWVEGMKSGYPSKVVETSGLSGGFSLSPDNFPAKLYTRTRIMTDSGEKEITAVIPLEASGQKTDVGMYSRNIGTASLASQTDVNKFFDKEISGLRSAINMLQSVNTTGVQVPITQKVMELEQRINKLDSPL